MIARAIASYFLQIATHRRLALLSLLSLSMMCAVTAPCFAQLTGKQFLATVVEKHGPEYADVDTAIEAFRRGEFAQSRGLLEAAAKKHPELAPADVMLAYLFMTANRRPEAEVALERALLLVPADPEAYIVLSDIAMREQHFGLADLGYQQARKLVKDYEANPKRAANMQIRIEAGQASIAESRAQFDKAKELLQAWIALEPKNPVPTGSLGRISFREKDYEGARKWFDKLHELDSSAPPADIAMGQLFSDAGMRDKALASMKAALDGPDGKDIRTQASVGEWALNGGMVELAQQTIAAALKTDKDSVVANVLTARLARQNGKFADAEAILNNLVLRSPNQFFATNELARTLAANADKKKQATGLQYAARNYQQLGKRQIPEAREAIMTYAWLLSVNGRTKEAAVILNSLPNGSTISAENSYYAAKIYATQGDRITAIGALKASLAPKIDFPGRTDAEALLMELSGEKSSASGKALKPLADQSVSSTTKAAAQPVK